MASRKTALLAGIVVVAVLLAVAPFLLLRNDDPAGVEQAQDVELFDERESLGMFSRDEALDRVSEIVSFEVWDPGDALPASLRLAAVVGRSLAQPGTSLLAPRFATLYYHREPPGPDDPGPIKVEQWADAPDMSVGDEWETETLTIGSLAGTAFSKSEDLAAAVFVVRIPGTKAGFNVNAPLAFKDQALAVTRAFVEAYEARQ